MTTMLNHVLKRKSHNKITLTRTKKKSNLVVMLLPCILKQGENFKSKKIKTQRLIDYDNHTGNLVDNRASLLAPLGKCVFAFL